MTISTFTSSKVQKRERKHATLIQENQTIFFGDDLEKLDVMEANFTFFFDNRKARSLPAFQSYSPHRPSNGPPAKSGAPFIQRGKVDQPPLECYHWNVDNVDNVDKKFEHKICS